MSRLHFTDYSGRRPQQPAPSRKLEILLIAVIGAVCALIVTWPHG